MEYLGVRLPVSLAHLHVGLLSDPVEVLVEAVQQEGEQLLAVLLLVAGELGGEPAHGHLESSGHDVGELPAPHILDQLAECPGGFIANSIDFLIEHRQQQWPISGTPPPAQARQRRTSTRGLKNAASL